MTDWPAYVEHAFSMIQLIGTDEEYINEFSRRWGNLELATFARALHQGTNKDQQVAAFAVGYTGSRWARNLLLPFLHHDHSELRWAASLSLGEMREEAAFSVLLNMLQEFLPPHPVENDWYDVQHLYVASILGSWGNQAAIPALRDTLTRLWQTEQQQPAGGELEAWWHYQDALAYALGQLEAFEALADLNAPLPRRRLWMVNLIMGYLNAEKIYHKGVLRIIQDAPLNEELATFLKLVATLLQEKLSLSQQEAAPSIENYAGAYFDRWEPPIARWSQCKQ